MTHAPQDPQQQEFDVFLSYAHADNRGEHEGKVSTLLEIIKEEHLHFTPDPLRVFFDTDDIRDMDDWEHRIYLGLRQSKVMLAVLSPNYFASVYCRKEWERYVQLELQRRHPGEGIAPIYVMEHPDFEQNPERLEEWLKNLKRRQYVDIRHWWPEGQQSLQREDVRKRLAKLEQQVYERLRGIRAADESPRQLPERYEKFVGREEQLRQLKESLSFDSIRAITAVQGIGGIGKTALAIEYAYRYADIYPGGRYKIDCAGKTDVRADLVELAESFFGLVFPESEKMQPEVAFRKARAKLEAAPLWLLILDNVDFPELLSVRNRNERLPTAEKVHILATTRLEPERLGGVGCLPLDSLTTEEALQLLFQYRPLPEGARESDEWHAALEIANRLGGHALAVQVVAVHLWQHPEVSYCAFRDGLVHKGIGRKLDQAGRDAVPAGQIEHPETLIDALLEPTLNSLSPSERLVLEYAALLPPDHVPLPWLRELVEEDLPDPWRRDPDDPDPWLAVARRLEGLRLLVPNKERRLARMHRIVQEVVRGRSDDSAQARSAREERLNQYTLNRGRELVRNCGRPDVDWELVPLTELARRLLDQGAANGAILSCEIVDALVDLGRSNDAKSLLKSSVQINAERARQFPNDASAQRECYRTLYSMGSLLGNDRKMNEAYLAFEQGHQIIESLARRFPDDIVIQRDWSISLSRLGTLALWEQSNLVEALRFYEQSREICESLARAHPDDLGAQRDWLASLNKLGDLACAEGKLEKGRRYFQQALDIAECLAKALPENYQAQRDLSVSFSKLGQVACAEGKLEDAEQFYQRDLEIVSHLLRTFPENSEAKEGGSFTLNKLGDLAVRQGKSEEAKRYFQQDLELSEQMARERPDDICAQQRWSRALQRVGEISLNENNLTEARKYFLQDLDISERHSQAYPDQHQFQRDLAVSYFKMFELSREGEGEEHKNAAVLWLGKCHAVLKGMREKGMFLDPPIANLLQQLDLQFGN